ncbi:MAG: aminotransferase class I/II-fold pyridoxal phosphate-dependent enzyme [Candidatus Krumholzibacteria bacterium]|nr:aminotransferase class I/II-fold pyridoxal phosphate-dependent enzyme [Candidatus Krumholzibacteria bacterium]
MRSKRLAQLPPYLFVEIDRLRESYLRSGRGILDLGIGDPDLGAPQELVDALVRALSNSSHHRYPPSRGSIRLIDAVRSWAMRYHGAALDRDEVLVTIGSKEAIAHLPLAIVDPGDAVLIPDPGYPVYCSSAGFAGASCVRMPLDEEADFKPRFSDIAPDDLALARLMFLNYPNNPTAAVADREFYLEAIEFCRSHRLALASDAAYSEIWYEEPTVPVFPLAREAEIPYVEFFSFSKTFSATGWRVGYAVGTKEIIASLSQLKNNIDSGVFGAIQEAVAETMERHYEGIMSRIRDVYRERRDELAAHLERSGLSFAVPRATFYFWIRTPRGMGSMEFCRLLLEECGIVATPGIGFGEKGEGFFRLSITAATETVREAGRRIEALGGRLGVR